MSTDTKTKEGPTEEDKLRIVEQLMQKLAVFTRILISADQQKVFTIEALTKIAEDSGIPLEDLQGILLEAQVEHKQIVEIFHKAAEMAEAMEAAANED